MKSFVLIFVILAGTMLTAASARHKRGVKFVPSNWKGYKEGDRFFYFPGQDGKIYKIDAQEPVNMAAIRNYGLNTEDIQVPSPASARHKSGVKFVPSNWKGYKESDRFFYFPGEDGKIYKIDAQEPVNMAAIRNYTCCPNHNDYWLYTRLNTKHKQVLKMGDKKSVQNSNFDPNKTTVFTSHGWLGDGNTEMNKLLTKVFLKDADVNVIVLDWSQMAKMGYITAKESVPGVGRMYAKFIDWLRQTFNMSLRNIHLVGHSLGGHVVGSAGRELKGAAQRITALDPAGPLWYLDSRRLSKSDGRYVEVIHTNAYMAGYPNPCGHSDHYPNGGVKMIGCLLLDLVCHHSRSWKYMAASIEYNKFFAKKCLGTSEAFHNQCSGAAGLMGNSDIYKKQSGIYRINTLPKYPYIQHVHL